MSGSEKRENQLSLALNAAQKGKKKESDYSDNESNEKESVHSD